MIEEEIDQLTAIINPSDQEVAVTFEKPIKDRLLHLQGPQEIGIIEENDLEVIVEEKDKESLLPAAVVAVHHREKAVLQALLHHHLANKRFRDSKFNPIIKIRLQM